MSNTLIKLEIFYYVARLQSFSRAAIELGVSKGYISQQISDLEAELGVKLLHRSTRQMKLSEAGELLLVSCEKISKEKKTAFTLIEELKTQPVGKLKITAPPSLCATLLTQVMPEFNALYPALELQIEASSSMKNLFNDDVDIALRITHQPDLDYIAKQVTSFHFVVCATPDYLNHHPAIKKPTDLYAHRCLVYSVDPSGCDWSFNINSQLKIIKVQSNFQATDSLLIRAALLAGNGIARLPEYVVADAIQAGKVSVLLQEFNSGLIPIYALYPTVYTATPKIKYFVKYLQERLKLK